MGMTGVARIAALALFGAVAAQGAAAQTLSDTLRMAYRNSGLLEQQRATLRAADEDVAQAVADLRPTIDYIARVGYSDPVQPGADNTSASLSLTAEMLLYDFGRSKIAVEAQKETVLATRAALENVENAVLLNAVNAYLNVRRASAFVGLRENNVRLLTEQLRATRDRFDVGEVTRTDVSLAEARLAAARSGLAAERGGLAVAREQYKAAVGVYPGTLAPPPAPPRVPATEEAGKAVARADSPEIEQVRHQVAAAELIVEQAGRALYPSLTGSGTYSMDEDGDDSLSLGVQLAGPIYHGGSIASQIRKAKANRDAARAGLYTTTLDVEQQVGTAYANLAVAVASIDASDRQVRAASLALEGVREELSLGARTTLEVLDQENELLDARTNRVAAEIDRYAAAYQILDATGLLTADYLGLGVPTYDPSAYYNAVKGAPVVDVSPQGKKLDHILKAIGRD